MRVAVAFPAMFKRKTTIITTANIKICAAVSPLFTSSGLRGPVYVFPWHVYGILKVGLVSWINVVLVWWSFAYSKPLSRHQGYVRVAVAFPAILTRKTTTTIALIAKQHQQI